MTEFSENLDKSSSEIQDLKKRPCGVFKGDKYTDFVMPDGRVIPSAAKAVDLIISHKEVRHGFK